MPSTVRPDLFDMTLRTMRRDRAARIGGDPFLAERAFQEIVERLQLIRREFDRALLIGCPDPSWRGRLGAARVDAVDPGRRFARAAGGEPVIEDRWQPEPGAYDLIVAVGTLDTVNDLPLALGRIRGAMRADALLIGAMSGGDTLPRLRSAMRAADAVADAAAPHVHPRIEASMVAPLLIAARFTAPVVDVDRVDAGYRSLGALVADLRATGATNILTERPRNSLSKRALEAAAENFARAGDGERTIETFEILHFAAWTQGN
jgi:NADH dehydrogenase [ubiquinone] 1 alpha subcomplex assembly factor 5